KSLALASGFASAARFYPPEVGAADVPVLDAAFTDLRGGASVGLMTSFVAVSRDHRVEFPHYHFYSALMAALRALHLDDAAEYLNYLFFFAAAVAVFAIERRLGGEAALAGALFLSF